MTWTEWQPQRTSFINCTWSWLTSFMISSEFLYLAVEADISENDWKNELYHQIITELQKLTMTEINKNGSFQEFSSFYSQTASHLEVINYHTQRNQQFQTSGSPDDQRNLQSIKRELWNEQSKSLNDNQNWLMHEGKCFTCFEHDHCFYECPKKRLDSEIKNLEREKSNHMSRTTDLRNV